VRAIRNSRQLSEISFPGNSKSPFRPHNQSFSRINLSRAAFARSRSGAKIASNRPSANASEIVFAEIRKLCAQPSEAVVAERHNGVTLIA
jgi:hypothetical protein